MKKKSTTIALVLLGLFLIWTVLVVCGYTEWFDNIVYRLVRSVECRAADWYFVNVTKFGDTYTVMAVVILYLLIFRNRDRILVLLTAVVSTFSNQAIKYLIRRDRPDVLKLISQGGYSYPSGHTMISIALYGVLLYFVIKKIRNRKLKYALAGVLSILILSIGISRIYVGVHYASDILGGYLLVIPEVVLLINFSNRYFRGN